MDENEMQQTVSEFERARAQLMSVSAQKQQLQLQSNALNASLEELGKTKEKKVYKAAGSILVLKDAADAKKELADQKESNELRLKTVQKQEDALLDKLNKLRSKIEGTQKPEAKAEGKKEEKVRK